MTSQSGGAGEPDNPSKARKSSFTEHDYNSPMYRWKKERLPDMESSFKDMKGIKGSMRVEIFNFQQYLDTLKYPPRTPGDPHNHSECDVPDIACLRSLFGKEGFFKNCGILVNKGSELNNAIHNNCKLDHPSQEGLRQKLKKIADEDEENNNYDCFMFVFLCYGEDESVIICHDGKKIEIKDILEPFKGKMLMKPKIFIFQACDIHKMKEAKAKGGPPAAIKYVTKKIPLEADFLTIHSDIPGYEYAWKEGGKPSLLIASLKGALDNCEKSKKDLLSLTPRINGLMKEEMKKYNDDIMKRSHVPRVTSTLTKLLYFTQPQENQQQ